MNPSVTLPYLMRWFWCFIVGHRKGVLYGTFNRTCIRCGRHAEIP